MQKLIVSLCLAGYIGTISLSPAFAQNRCPAGETNCTMDDAFSNIQDRVHEGARNVIRDENPGGRAEEIKDTLKDCMECGANAIKSGINNISGSGAAR